MQEKLENVNIFQKQIFAKIFSHLYVAWKRYIFSKEDIIRNIPA